ncbi:MAG: Rab family GTPase [Candidatus Hodarchaeota archaeon]
MINYIWIIKDSGENLFYKTFGSTMQLDESLISGLFMALNLFVKESGKGDIDFLVLKDEKFIYKNFGPIFLVLGCDRSDNIEKVKDIMVPIGNRFLEKFGSLKNWNGEVKIFRQFSDIMNKEFKFEDLSIFESPQLLKEEIKNGKKFFYKIIIVGNEGVGKTSIIQKFSKDRFESKYKPTLGLDLVKYSYSYDLNTNLAFTAWDISGKKSFKTLRKSYYPNTEAFLIIYDITQLESFQEVEEWMNEIRQYGKKDSIFILVGNKIDLENDRIINLEDGKDKASKYKFEFFETSAKTGQNISELFNFLGKKIIEKRKIAE